MSLLDIMRADAEAEYGPQNYGTVTDDTPIATGLMASTPAPKAYDPHNPEYDYSGLNTGLRNYYDKLRKDYGDEAFYSSNVIKNNIAQKVGFSQGRDVLAERTAGATELGGLNGSVRASNTSGMMQLQSRSPEWEANKNFILSQAQQGLATPEQMEWLQRYQEAGGQVLEGTPDKQGMMQPPEGFSAPHAYLKWASENPEENAKLISEKWAAGEFTSEQKTKTWEAFDNNEALKEHYSQEQLDAIYGDKEYGRYSLGRDHGEEALQHYDRLTEHTDVMRGFEGQPISNKEKMDGINKWWSQTHHWAVNDPAAFNQWAEDNHADAIKFYARLNNKHVENDMGLTRKQAKMMAMYHAQALGQELGYGDDMKKDGKMIAFDYDTFKDVTNEWGPGDWYKLGTPQTMTKGFDAFVQSIQDNPGEFFGGLAISFAIPMLAGPLAATMGISKVAATAILQGTSTMLQGGSAEDALKEIALGYGLDVGLDKLAPHMKDWDIGGIGSGKISVEEQLKALKEIAKSGGDPRAGLGSIVGGELGQSIFENDQVYNSLINRGWEPVAMAEAMREMGAEGLEDKDIYDLLLSGATKYYKNDGSLGTIPLPDVELGDLPGGEMIGDLLEKGEQGLDEVYEFIRDDLPDIDPGWFDGDLLDGGFSPTAPQWVKDLVDDAGQYGDEVYEFIRDDLPDIQPDLPGLPNPDLPNIGMPDIPDIPLPDLPGLPDTPDMPDIPGLPDIDLPNIDLPNIDLPSGGGGSEGMMAMAGGPATWGEMPEIIQIAKTPWDSSMVQALLSTVNSGRT